MYRKFPNQPRGRITESTRHRFLSWIVKMCTKSWQKALKSKTLKISKLDLFILPDILTVQLSIVKRAFQFDIYLLCLLALNSFLVQQDPFAPSPSEDRSHGNTNHSSCWQTAYCGQQCKTAGSSTELHQLCVWQQNLRCKNCKSQLTNPTCKNQS